MSSKARMRWTSQSPSQPSLPCWLPLRLASDDEWVYRQVHRHPPLIVEEWETNLRCATDVAVLRRALSFYRPTEGVVESTRIAMVEVMFIGSKAMPWWDPSTPAQTRDDGGREIAKDRSFQHKGCCIHCGSGMGRARPETGHDTKALGYAGMTAGACPHIEKIKAQGDCPLCSRICSLWRASQEFKELQSDPKTKMVKGRPSGVARNHLEVDCLLGGGMRPTAFSKVRTFIEGLATAATIRAISMVQADTSRIRGQQKRDAEWRSRGQWGAIGGHWGGHPRGAPSSRHRDDRDGPRREPVEVVNNLSSPAPVTPARSRSRDGDRGSRCTHAPDPDHDPNPNPNPYMSPNPDPIHSPDPNPGPGPSPLMGPHTRGLHGSQAPMVTPPLGVGSAGAQASAPLQRTTSPSGGHQAPAKPTSGACSRARGGRPPQRKAN